jgi:hypothetical protein
MESGIGFVAGRVLTGFALVKLGTAVRVTHQWFPGAEASVKQKMDAKAASLKSKL